MHTGAIGHTSFNKHKSSFYSSSFYSWQLLGPHEQCRRSVPLTQTLDPAPRKCSPQPVSIPIAWDCTGDGVKGVRGGKGI